ncbi:MAG: signal recognition particle-docking protein FtsY [Alphaproteobacteria bacterium]|nr:signal recognition particle-docking protein FtsY [Alphaproteobacteria bacterium]
MSDQKTGLLARLRAGLRKSSDRVGEQIASVFTKRRLDAETLDELEDALIGADMGPAAAARITKALRAQRHDKDITGDEIRAMLATEIERILAGPEVPPPYSAHKPYVSLVIGVNGVGKTTTIGKIARALQAQDMKVTLAAGDTFRAAAIEQLKIWGGRTGATVVARAQGADAAGLVFDAYKEAQANGSDVLLVDTAGRLQNKQGLMDELAKVIRVLKKVDPSAPHETMLIVDATTGQNALAQIDTFKQVAGVTSLTVTKLDGTARGGAVVAATERSGLPVRYVGLGEGAEDLQYFDPRGFARALVGLEP